MQVVGEQRRVTNQDRKGKSKFMFEGLQTVELKATIYCVLKFVVFVGKAVEAFNYLQSGRLMGSRILNRFSKDVVVN